LGLGFYYCSDGILGGSGYAYVKVKEDSGPGALTAPSLYARPLGLLGYSLDSGLAFL
jgi:hypothetical protein